MDSTRLQRSGVAPARLARAALIALTMGGAAVARAEAPPASTPAVIAPASEQPRTLLSRPIHSGGYGAPMVSWTRFAGDDAALVGARGGWVLNHRLVIGGGGAGIATSGRRPTAGAPDEYRHSFGYGGLWLEYLIAPMNVVHGSVGTLVGGGGIGYLRVPASGDMKQVASTTVFVLDPVAAVEVNVTTFLRFAVEGGYRVVRGVDLTTLGNRQASGFTLGGALKLGSF